MKTREVTKNYRLNKWAAIISECRGSGQTVEAWCSEHNIKPASYYYWLRRVREAACEALPTLTGENNSIVPVDFSSITVNQMPQASIVLRVGSVVLELHNNASTTLIENTFKALENVR